VKLVLSSVIAGCWRHCDWLFIYASRRRRRKAPERQAASVIPWMERWVWTLRIPPRSKASRWINLFDRPTHLPKS